MKLVILGLSITSSWGNGHATTYRALVRELAKRGHEILFLERDVPWYAENRDFVNDDPFVKVVLYQSLEELYTYASLVELADAVMVGSYVPDGIAVSEWVTQVAGGVTVFYDIDTPVTLAQMERGTCEYLAPKLIPQFDLFLSFTGGPTLDRLESKFGSPCARPFHCSVDPEFYFPEAGPELWNLGYLGTYSDDRQPTLNRLLLEPAQGWTDGRFVVAGPQYPPVIEWPDNVERIEHLSPDKHRAFYNSQAYTLNVTRADMILAGYSPSVRLFEAAACGTPIISDWWEGLDSFFAVGKEVLIARDSEEVIKILRDIPLEERKQMGLAAREKVLASHTAAHRAAELEGHLAGLSKRQFSHSA